MLDVETKNVGNINFVTFMDNLSALRAPSWPCFVRWPFVDFFFLLLVLRG